MNARWGMRTLAIATMAAGLAASAAVSATPGDAGKGGYQDLVTLFTEWRAFEAPPLREGAPDYTAATVARRQAELGAYRARLEVFDTGGWSIEQKVDREILRASLQRAAILSNEKYRGIRFAVKPAALTIQSHNPEQEEAEEELEVAYDGPELEIGFNVNYLLDALAAIDGPDVEVGLTDGNSSCLVRSKTDAGARFVVMPMRL